jgi:hypothetical protein
MYIGYDIKNGIGHAQVCTGTRVDGKVVPHPESCELMARITMLCLESLYESLVYLCVCYTGITSFAVQRSEYSHPYIITAIP